MSVIRNLTGVNVNINGTEYHAESTIIQSPYILTPIVGDVNGIVVKQPRYSTITTLPDVIEDTYFIVHPMVAQAFKDTRTDLLYLNYASDAIRNSKGVVTQFNSLVRP